MWQDISTLLLRQSLRVLGVDYPKRLAIAILSTIAISRAAEVATRTLESNKFVNFLNELGFIGVLPLALILLFMPSIRFGRHAPPEYVDNAINAFEAVLNKMNASPAQRNMMYNGLLSVIVKKIDLDNIKSFGLSDKDLQDALEASRPDDQPQG
ncbi:hypothetical protein [Azospirillum sp. Marseille-Q6669]